MKRKQWPRWLKESMKGLTAEEQVRAIRLYKGTLDYKLKEMNRALENVLSELFIFLRLKAKP